jgi:hypothetical protein
MGRVAKSSFEYGEQCLETRFSEAELETFARIKPVMNPGVLLSANVRHSSLLRKTPRNMCRAIWFRYPCGHEVKGRMWHCKKYTPSSESIGHCGVVDFRPVRVGNACVRKDCQYERFKHRWLCCRCGTSHIGSSVCGRRVRPYEDGMSSRCGHRICHTCRPFELLSALFPSLGSKLLLATTMRPKPAARLLPAGGAASFPSFFEPAEKVRTQHTISKSSESTSGVLENGETKRRDSAVEMRGKSLDDKRSSTGEASSPEGSKGPGKSLETLPADLIPIIDQLHFGTDRDFKSR